MAQYAYYDPAAVQPAPVLGWFDTDAIEYPNLPALASLLVLTDAQWASRMVGTYAVSAGALVAYTAPAAVLTVAQQAAAAVLAGCALTCTSTPAINSTYACDAESRSDIMAETVSLLMGGVFTNGGTTLLYADAKGTMQSFDVDTFKKFAPAIGGYVGALKAIMVTGAGTLPAQPLVIA